MQLTIHKEKKRGKRSTILTTQSDTQCHRNMPSYAAKLFWPAVSDTTTTLCARPGPISSILPKLGVEKQSEKTKKHCGNSIGNIGKTSTNIKSPSGHAPCLATKTTVTDITGQRPRALILCAGVLPSLG